MQQRRRAKVCSRGEGRKSAVSPVSASAYWWLDKSRLIPTYKDRSVKTERTLYDRIITNIKNTPILASLIVFGVVIIALSKFTTAIEDLGKFFYGHESEKIATMKNDTNISLVNIGGKWVTDSVPDVLDENVTCERLFNFIQDNEVLLGRMKLMCSDGFDWEFEIKNGKVRNKSIYFFVQRRTYGRNKRDLHGNVIPGEMEFKDHKVFYKGSVSDNVIDLKVQDERGYPPQSIVATRGNIGRNK